MSLEFRFATLEEYPRVSEFLDRHWASGHIYTRQRDLFDWSFHRPGYWKQDNYSFMLGLEEGELIGILGGIPFSMNEFGRRSEAIWIVNYTVRSDHRKGMTALKLLSAFHRPEFGAVVAFGLTPETIPIYKVLRGKVLPEIPRHFLVMPGCTEKVTDLLTRTHADWMEGRSRELANAFVTRKTHAPIAAEVVGDMIPRRWDEADWPEHASPTVGAARDSSYLNWRYLSHPLFKYRFISVRDGSRTGLAVWRPEMIRQERTSGREDVGIIGRLVEFLPASSANAEALFGSFLQELRDAGAIAADFYSYHGQTRQWLQQLGFSNIGIHPDGRALPSRFQPLDSAGAPILGAVLWSNSAPPCLADDNCSWYWTKSDSDQDRPN